MLETDEVDVDFFTPAESTSLANIFAKGSQADEATENPSMKYVPPAPPTSKPEVKPTQWIFTCAVHGFEWSSSGYISKGKLGLAILKVVKTNNHSIILYDSNKSTVSYVTISSRLKIHKRDGLTISYYDNAQKYWSIQTSDEDMNKMLQLLQNLQATIVNKSFQETDREQSDTNKVDNKNDENEKYEANKDEKEIDTDSYMNQKTKDSILKRMANMGHSVLPPHGSSKVKTSDSSDSDDIDGNKINIRHKPVKSVPKRSTDSTMQETDGNAASHSRKVVHKSHTDGQSLVTNKGSNAVCSGDLNIFVSEQRISNSELRINVNRMSDKIDLILERINYVTNTDKNNSVTDFQNDIVQKLIREYESKIKTYEDFMSSKGIDCHSINSSATRHMKSTNTENHLNIEAYEHQIEELKNTLLEKESIIISMKDEMKYLNETKIMVKEENKKVCEDLLKEKQTMKDLKVKYEDIVTKMKELENDNMNSQESSDITNRVKKIMNDTFQAISVNFNDEETYSGEALKSIIGTIIKKTTIEALKEF